MPETKLTVVKKKWVSTALHALRELKVHRTFPGYLCVRRTAHIEGRNSKLNVDFKSFYDDFLKVPGRSKPYIYPFIEHKPSKYNIWYNKNPAGSYAQSSLRDGVSPILRAVQYEGSGRDTRYSLVAKHWRYAREHLCYENKIPAAELAVVLYRDYALRGDASSSNQWIRVFQEEFGYLDDLGEPTEEYLHLYTDSVVVDLKEHNLYKQINAEQS